MDLGVGIGGYSLAGGLGYFTRKFGYAADNVVEFELILGKQNNVLLFFFVCFLFSKSGVLDLIPPPLSLAIF